MWAPLLPKANPHGSTSALTQNTPQQPSHEGSVSGNKQDPGSRLTNSLAAGNERQSKVCKCCADYLS